MKRFSLSSVVLILLLLCVGSNKAQAQSYSTVVNVPITKWDFSVVDDNFNPVATLAPNTHYYLYLRLNSGVSVDDLVAYIVQDGDGWYQSANQRPQTFFTGVDANGYYPNHQGYFSFTTVEADDFSGAFFKIRLSNTGLTSGQPAGSLPKSKLFQ